MNRSTGLAGVVVGAAAGATAMYFLDPRTGRRRRRQFHAKALSVSRGSARWMRKAGRDLGNRAAGINAAVQALLRFGAPLASDQQIEDRVRTKLGRLVSHPVKVEVTALAGEITLRGSVARAQVHRLLRGIRSVRGVRMIHNHLRITEEPAGEARGQYEPAWTPSARVLAGATGGALTIWGLTRTGPMAAGGLLLGSGLAIRAVAKRRARSRMGGELPVEAEKTIAIGAPIHQVFAFWSNFGNLPRFMTHVREVRNLANGRWLWVVEDPAGTSVSWEAEVTRFEPNRMLGWKSVPGAGIDISGIVQFEAAARDRTRIRLRLSYRRCAGFLGDRVARLFGKDLTTQAGAGLIRLKSLLENGEAGSTAGGTVRPEGLGAMPADGM
jgi:uncharacterized membrane protein/gas vesicle protein